MSRITLVPEEFNSIKKGGLLAEALGDLVPDVLGQLTVTSNPYKLNLTNIALTGVVYKVSVPVQNLSDGVITTQEVEYTSSANPTIVTVSDGLIAAADAAVPKTLHIAKGGLDNTTANQYLTIVATEGYKVTAAPTLTNLSVSTEKVQAPIGKPAAHISYIDSPTVQYPRLVVTHMTNKDVSTNFNSGSINLSTDADNPDWAPYYDSYIKAYYKVVVEAGSYSELISERRRAAEDIIKLARIRLNEDNRFVTFCEKVNATFNDKWSIKSMPSLQTTEMMNSASFTICLDVIDRYIEPQGDIMTKVVLSPTANLRHQGNEDPEIALGQTIERTDIP